MYMYKDGSKILVDRSQVSAMEEAGWSRTPAENKKESPAVESASESKSAEVNEEESDESDESETEAEDTVEKLTIRKPRKIGKK